MEKEPQPESLATVTIKPDYPPSEVYSSEPPPAYHRSQSSTVQATKIVAITVVLVSIILGSFWLASAYVQANASCKQLEQELALLSEAADRFQPPPPPLPPQAEALIQNESQQQKTEEVPKKTKDIDNNSIEASESSDSSSESTSNESDDYEDKTPIKFKLPLQLDFDDLAGALIEKNQRSRMNCIVEKKRAEEVVDHQPKTLRLPFGLNLTTDPRYEHVSGERMAIFCESGNIQRNTPHQNEEENDDDSEEETIMIQPVMIPIPQSHFPTHMAHQMPQPQPQPQPIQYQEVHPMETMRPPMPPAIPQQNQFPPNQILHHIAQQIVAQKIMEAQRAREQQFQQQLQQQQQQQQQQEQEPEQTQEVQQEMTEPRIIPQRYPMMPQNIPLPEEVLTQLNRLPNRDVIVAVSEHETDDDDDSQDEQQPQQQEQQQQIRMMPQVVQQEVRMMPHEIRVVQEPRQGASEMNGRQSYARGLPVHIPIHMIQQEQQQQEPQAVASEEARPHYVQPRSLRSVDALLEKNQKRVKRCSCDCAC